MLPASTLLLLGQLSSLATTDGSVLYFSTSLRIRGMNATVSGDGSVIGLQTLAECAILGSRCFLSVAEGADRDSALGRVLRGQGRLKCDLLLQRHDRRSLGRAVCRPV
jgi:hypothetical protein